jgi:tRNA(fMet)-specific endonuclease VapC
MRLTLDTNICSYILRRHPANMIERFAALERSQVWLSAIVAAELRFGASKLASMRFSAAVESWLAGFDVRPWPVEASHYYAQMRSALERVGKPVGAMDMLIAAHALAEDSAIITNNAREFHRVPGLAVQEWAIE